MNMTLRGALVALALALPATASAAVWDIDGGAAYVLPNLGNTTNSFNPNVANSGNGLNELAPTFLTEGLPAFPTVYVGGKLGLLQNVASLTFQFFGREAGAFNSAFDGGLLSILSTANAVEDGITTGPVASGPLAFKFTSTFGSGTSAVNGGLALGANLAFALSPFDENIAWAFFDDGGGANVYKCATGDCDYDDMVVRITATPLAIPLPIPAVLLLGGIATLGAVARRRRNAA